MYEVNNDNKRECAWSDECNIVQESYNKGREDAIDECIKVIDEVNWLESDTYIGLLEKLKEK